MLVQASTILAISAVGLAAPFSKRAPSWAPASSAAIHPGVNTDTAGGSCTSNFIFYNGAGDIYIGQAAHCSSTGGSTSTNGCDTGSQPIGTPVNVTGASKLGTLAYNSWLSMQANKETDANTCAYNDLALVKLDSADYSKVNPSIPVFGGPTGVRTTGLKVPEAVYSYGNSILRGGIKVLSPKYGTNLEEAGGGWSHQVGTLTPGIPGDSGSLFVDAAGKGFGVLSTLAFAPIPATNGVGDVGKELAYLRRQPGFSDIQIATGTVPFKVAPPSVTKK